MYYRDEEIAYFEGKQFSNAGVFVIKHKDSQLFSRDSYLLEKVKNKKVLHLGFVDHVPLLDDKIERGVWLHQKLMEVTECCYGVDINKEGIDYLQDHYGVEHLFALDITSDQLPDEILGVEFDYLLIPDVIEHIANPVAFLESIRKQLHTNVKEVILTTPNAFRWNNFMNVFKHSEVINTDHRFWFTAFTLSKVLIDAGYVIEELSYGEHGKVSKKRFIKYFMLKHFVLFRDTLVIEAKL